MTEFHVAHFNRGYLRGPFGSAEIEPFESAIDTVNSVAQRSPGYIRNVDVDPEEARRAFFPADAALDRIAATLSVWDDPHRLADFALRTIHGSFLKRRGEWFEVMEGPAYVVWPIPAGHVPTLAEAKLAYERLKTSGPSDAAFDFKWLGPSPGGT